MRQFEKMVDTLLASDLNLNYKFIGENKRYSWEIKTKVKGQTCLECGCPMYKLASYNPDFILTSPLGNETIIEVKGGTFKATDQAKYKRFVKQYPHLRYVIAFRTNVMLKNLRPPRRVKQWGLDNGIDVVVGIDQLKMYLTSEVGL